MKGKIDFVAPLGLGALLLALTGPSHAQPATSDAIQGVIEDESTGARSPAPALPLRPWRYSVGVGVDLPLTGSMGPSLAAAVEVRPGRRVGGIARAQVSDAGDRGLATIGLLYEAGAARPRLWLELHAELGATWGEVHPVVGGGVLVHLTVFGPVGIVVDTGAHLVYDGVDTELALSSTLLLALAR